MFKYDYKINFEDEKSIQYIFKFENGRGASVLKWAKGYGDIKKPYELAVLFYTDNDDYILDYSTEITQSEIRGLNIEEVNILLDKIKSL